jgi:hypothetical protein
MKANELRIGNWVNFIGSRGRLYPFTIKAIIKGNIIDDEPEDFVYEVMYSGYLFKQIEPIPLTPKLMGKIFKKKINAEKERQSFYITVNGKRYFIWYNKKMGRLSFQNICVKNVHQLQNLYFALTGEELEINL